MKLSDFIYVPRQGGYKFTRFQCAFAIEGLTDKNGRYIKYHQCQNKPKLPIGEHGFCKQHHKLISAHMEEARNQNIKDLGF